MNLENGLLRAENLWFGYKPQEWILKGVSLNIRPGSLNMVMGASGSGKTTLLKVLGGLLPCRQGRIFLSGEELTKGFSIHQRSRIGYIPQLLGLVRNLTVLENVLIGTLSRCQGLGPLLGIFPKKETGEAKEILKQLGLGHKMETKTFCLSGGERQRVAIARTLMQRPVLVLADEFVSDLDMKTACEILELVKKIAKESGAAFLINMHELQLVKKMEGDVFSMKGGQLIHQPRFKESGQLSPEEMSA